MTKKIQDTTKTSPIFVFAKLKGLNNREASRFFSLFSSEQDFTSTNTDYPASIAGYLMLCREPNIQVPEQSIANENDVPSRSKLVMAYEKQRKAYLKIKEIRATKPEQVNTLFKQLHPYELVISAGMTYRQNALQHILRHIV